MFDAIARVLAFFYSLPVVGGSVGYAIILLTAAVMMLLMPLTLRATRSQIKMQEVQPKLKELQKEYKDDRQTLNQELMALYSENGINPVGGCLPMLAQLPVFLVLFNVLRGLSRRVADTPYFALSQEARLRAGGEAVAGDTFAPRYLSPESELYQDLSVNTEIGFGPLDLGLEALDVIQDNFLRGIPYVILILFVVASSYYQQRQVSARRGSGGMGMNPQQEMILRFLPILSGVWSFVFPAGLVLYWATSNAFRIGQQSYITRRYYGEKEEQEAAGSDDGDDTAPGSATSTAKSSTGKSSSAKAGSAGKAPAKAGGAKNDSKSDSGSSTKTKSKNQSKTDSKTDSKNDRTGDAEDGDADERSNGTTRSSGRNGDGKNGSAPADGESRSEAWERRRQQKARTQAAAKNRREQSSRVTPKGTKPGGSKKKRKR